MVEVRQKLKSEGCKEGVKPGNAHNNMRERESCNEMLSANPAS